MSRLVRRHAGCWTGFAAEDAVYIATDVMGGSVNNEMLTLLPEYPAVHLICGMNASLVLTLASNDEAPDTGRTGRVHCRCQGADH